MKEVKVLVGVLNSLLEEGIQLSPAVEEVLRGAEFLVARMEEIEKDLSARLRRAEREVVLLRRALQALRGDSIEDVD